MHFCVCLLIYKVILYVRNNFNLQIFINSIFHNFLKRFVHSEPLHFQVASSALKVWLWKFLDFWTYLNLVDCRFSNSLESKCSYKIYLNLVCVKNLIYIVFKNWNFLCLFVCFFHTSLNFLFFSLQLRYLELLKLRFGESHLHFCEIMLKDVADSRRINSHIQASAAKNENTKVQYMYV